MQGLATFAAYAFGGIGYAFLRLLGLFALTIPLTGFAVICYRNASRLATNKEKELITTAG